VPARVDLPPARKSCARRRRRDDATDETSAERLIERGGHRACGLAQGDRVDARRPVEVEFIVEDFQTRAVEQDGAAHGAARVRLGERVVEDFARGAAQFGEFVQDSEGRS
jgi:hypothetical protein